MPRSIKVVLFIPISSIFLFYFTCTLSLVNISFPAIPRSSWLTSIIALKLKTFKFNYISPYLWRLLTDFAVLPWSLVALSPDRCSLSEELPWWPKWPSVIDSPHSSDNSFPVLAKTSRKLFILTMNNQEYKCIRFSISKFVMTISDHIWIIPVSRTSNLWKFRIVIVILHDIHHRVVGAVNVFGKAP